MPRPVLPAAGRAEAALAIAAALVLAPHLAPLARADLLPDTGTTVNVGGLRQQLEELLDPAAALPNPGWTIVPALGVEERWTDHLQGVGSSSGHSTFITYILPSVLINGQTSRTSTTVSYSPSLQFYTENGDQNRIDQNLNAFSNIILVPERLFLDLRAFAGLQPTYGGYGPSNTVAVTRQNETQTLGFSAHPYLRERFGDLAVAELGATVSYTSQNGLSGNNAGQTLVTTTGNGQDLMSQQEYFNLNSGPDFGRFSAGLSLTGSQSTGSGGINDSSRYDGRVTLNYAVTRDLSVLTMLGYDTMHYGGGTSYYPGNIYAGSTVPYSQAGIEWSGGLHWEPNPNSSINVSYGRQYGTQSAQLDASYALTARTRIYARYSQGITTTLEQQRNAINSSTLGPSGNPIGPTGTPQQIINNFYGTQNYLAQVTNASLTAVLLEDRDSFSLNLGYQESRQISTGNTTSTGPLDNTGYYGMLSWQHEFRPYLQSYMFGEVGSSNNGATKGNQNSDTLIFSLRLNYSISDTLNAYAQYSWSSQGYQPVYGTAGTVASNQPVNLIFIGVRKTF